MLTELPHSPTVTTTPTFIARRPSLSGGDVLALNRRFESASPSEIITWATERFGVRLALTASFADTVLIDIATAIDPDIEVIFLDTGFHFSETLTTVRRAMERYRLNLTVLRPPSDVDDVWGADSDTCCAARKVDPLDRYLVGHSEAWLSGLRRADSPDRADAPIISIDRRGLVKVNPIANLTDDEQAAYVTENDVIINPLAFEGYASIGCWPCTEPSTDGRAGRWAGAKTECGLHR